MNFPKDFYWGASTSAHQVEGENRNDWTEWEKENSARLAKEALIKLYPAYVLNDFPGPLRRENYISGASVDHYNRYEEDFDIAKSLKHNAHRFSIEWSRIEPKEGKFDEREIEHYRRVIQALKKRGVEPFVTLWHWTNPIWIRDIGGWENKKTINYFVRYVKKIIDSLQGVKFYTTLNEQEAFARHGYFLKDRPPARGSFFTAYKVLRNLAKSHKLAYQAIKSINPDLQVGFTESLVYFESYNYWPHNLLATRIIEWWRNNALFTKLVEFSDFIGLQYYFHSRIRLHSKSKWGIQFNENKRVSDMDWEIYPEGIYHVLQNLAEYKKPIYITENGLADADDSRRARFIEEHLKWIDRAIKEGVDVRGYFYWSLLDNFEWQLGFWPRFGLVEIDYKTMERKIRPSALFYKTLIAKYQNDSTSDVAQND